MEPIYPNEQPNQTASFEAPGEFDERFSTRPLRMLKALAPLLPEHIQSAIAISVRLQELQIALRIYTGAAFHKNTDGSGFTERFSSPDFFNQVFGRLEPILSPAEQSSFQKIRQTMQMFETMKQMEPLMQFFAQMQEESGSEANSSEENCNEKNLAKGTDISDLFSSLSDFGNLSGLSNLSGLARLSGLYPPPSGTSEEPELKAAETEGTLIQTKTDSSQEAEVNRKEEL